MYLGLPFFLLQLTHSDFGTNGRNLHNFSSSNSCAEKRTIYTFENIESITFQHMKQLECNVEEELARISDMTAPCRSVITKNYKITR